MSRRHLTRSGIVLAAWLVATGSGPCAFFKPTTPDTPNRPPIRADYSTPDSTLQTVARGMADKNQSNGQDVYMAALADSSTIEDRAFHAFFDQRDLLEHPWPYDWTRDFEPQLLRDLYLDYSRPFLMTWEKYEPGGNDEFGPDIATLHRKYTLVQLIPNGNTVTPSPIAIGAATLSFVRTPRRPADWVIAVWQDFRTADADSAQVTSMGRRRLETQH